jgi:formylmethanofuran dehydrogenase subunit E
MAGVANRLVYQDCIDGRSVSSRNKKERQLRTYEEAMDEELFKIEQVEVEYSEMDAPGHPRSRIVCARCGEGVNDGCEVKDGEWLELCRPCAFGAYYKTSNSRDGNRQR